jgi:hemerythrin
MPLTAKYKRLVTGIAGVDSEHFELIKLTVEAMDQVHAGQYKLAYLTIETLYDQFSYHCAMEEAMLKRWEYPYLEKHKLEHKRLKELMLDSLSTLLKSQDKPLTKIAEVISNALHNVVIEHIERMDFHYVNFVKGCETGQ